MGVGVCVCVCSAQEYIHTLPLPSSLYVTISSEVREGKRSKYLSMFIDSLLAVVLSLLQIVSHHTCLLSWDSVCFSCCARLMMVAQARWAELPFPVCGFLVSSFTQSSVDTDN